jgi:hypothetical protein
MKKLSYLNLGTNLIRNLASLGVWLLNIPRGALRMLVTGPVTPALLWISAVAVPMLAVWSLAGNTLLQVNGISTAISVQGTRMLDHPSLIGRARWAERVLSMLKDEQISRPLLVHPADDLRFYAIGAAGLSWRLGLDQRDVRVVDRCPDEADGCLEIDATGEWSWRSGRSRYSREAGR